LFRQPTTPHIVPRPGLRLLRVGPGITSMRSGVARCRGNVSHGRARVKLHREVPETDYPDGAAALNDGQPPDRPVANQLNSLLDRCLRCHRDDVDVTDDL